MGAGAGIMGGGSLWSAMVPQRFPHSVICRCSRLGWRAGAETGRPRCSACRRAFIDSAISSVGSRGPAYTLLTWAFALMAVFGRGRLVWLKRRIGLTVEPLVPWLTVEPLVPWLVAGRSLRGWPRRTRPGIPFVGRSPEWVTGRSPTPTLNECAPIEKGGAMPGSPGVALARLGVTDSLRQT